MFVLLVYSEYQENLSNILPPDQGCALITLKSFLHFLLRCKTSSAACCAACNKLRLFATCSL